MGRTGRKRKGKICLLLAEGHEETKYRRSQATYKSVQKAIAAGSNILYYPSPPRILPPDPLPTCDFVNINVPTFVAQWTGRKRKRVEEAGTDSGPKTNRNAFLDPEELARFQQRYRLPKRNVRGITFQSACAKLLESKKSSTMTPDTTFHVGHSTRTMDFIVIANRIAKSRVEQSLFEANGSSAEKDPFSKRMSDMIDRWGRTGLGSDDAIFDVVSKSRAAELSRRAKGGNPSALKQNLGRSLHDALTDDEMERLNALYQGTSDHGPARKRHVVQDDDDDDDDDDDQGGHGKNVVPKPLEPSRNNQQLPELRGMSATFKRSKTSNALLSELKGTGATFKRSKTSTALSGSSRPTVTKLGSIGVTPKGSIIPNFSTISDDEIDKEIMDGFGQSFEHYEDDDLWAPNALDTESIIYGTASYSARKRKGFDFQEPSTPLPLWYKPSDQSDPSGADHPTDMNGDTVEYDESFSVIELPPVPRAGQWYQPTPVVMPRRDLPGQEADTPWNTRERSKDEGVPAKKEEEKRILFIESSEDEQEMYQKGMHTLSGGLGAIDASTDQQRGLSTVKTLFLVPEHLTSKASGFVSAKSLVAFGANGMDKSTGKSTDIGTGMDTGMDISRGSSVAKCRGKGKASWASDTRFNHGIEVARGDPQGDDNNQGQCDTTTSLQLWGHTEEKNDRKARGGSSEIDDFDDLVLRDEDLQDDFLWE